MTYQVLKMNGSKFEKVATIEANTRIEANKQMAQMAKESENILYLTYYSAKRPDWHDVVIATATHLGEIINY